MPGASASVCAVIAEESANLAIAEINRAGHSADVLELRLDYLKDFDFARPELLKVFTERKSAPLVLTCRSWEEGGHQPIDHRTRVRLLVEGTRLGADYCDVEAAHYAAAARMNPDSSRLIVSYHNFSETPADIDSVYDRISALPAAVHKIVTRAKSISDTLAIFSLLDRARNHDRNLIALAMDEPGMITRILGPSRGCFMTYGTTRADRGTAPGQLTCSDLNSIYRLQSLSGGTAVTGLVGNPVSHSASPAIHNAAFAAAGLDFVYLPLCVHDVEEFFRRFVRQATREMGWNLTGLSVTLPHKRSVLPLLDRLDSSARDAGAVNTISMTDAGLIGYNTDLAGALAPLERVSLIEGEKVGVLGAGGAARAVVCGLVQRGARVSVFARSPGKAKDLTADFGVPCHPVEALEKSDVDIVINATPVGMRGHSEGTSPLGRQYLRGRRIVYDLVYNPVKTQLLEEAESEGCQILSGVEMLVAQAALQFEIWTGQKAPVQLMLAAALERLAD